MRGPPLPTTLQPDAGEQFAKHRKTREGAVCRWKRSHKYWVYVEGGVGGGREKLRALENKESELRCHGPELMAVFLDPGSGCTSKPTKEQNNLPPSLFVA